MIILGIDPGSRITGYGLINSQPSQIIYIASGHLKMEDAALPDRLGQIFQRISTVIDEYEPRHMSIENVFMQRNADSALKLGQARGAAICAAYQAGLEISEYAPREIKQALVGGGAANKDQVQHMVKRLLNLQKTLQADEGDGLAIAICHAQYHATQQKTGIDKHLFKRRTTGKRR